MAVIPDPLCAQADARSATKEERLNRWRDLRFGLFIHWGPYSALGGEWQGKAYPHNSEWIMRSAAIPKAAYREAARSFDPKAYDPDSIVAFAKESGFKYIVITAKHYDGFALFDSKVSDFDAVDVLPSKRDLLKEFSMACRKAGMPLGYSYAVDRDWYHPGGNTLGKAWDPAQIGVREDYLRKVALPQLKELVDGYGPAIALLADAGTGVPQGMVPSFQEAVGPDIVMPQDFAGNQDYQYTDGIPLNHTITSVDWEQCTNLGRSWGYRKHGMNYHSAGTVLRELVSTASKGGNYLLNIGLEGDGRVPDEAASRMKEVGDWLARHRESIYGTAKSPFVVHPWNGVATVRDEKDKGATLYLHLFGKERQGKITLGSMVTRPDSAEVMGESGEPAISGRPGRWELDLSGIEPRGEITVVKVKLPTMPEIGPGPIVAAEDGSFRLDPGRGSYADRRTLLGRTPSTPSLQVTGFADEKDSGVWEIYSDAAARMSLRLLATSAVAAEEKTLLVQVNDGPPIEARLATGTGPGAPFFTSTTFSLPLGLCRVRISGSTAGDAPNNPISTSLIELIPAK